MFQWERKEKLQVNKYTRISDMEVVCRKVKYGYVIESGTRAGLSQERTNTPRIDDKTDTRHAKTRARPSQAEGTAGVKLLP